MGVAHRRAAGLAGRVLRVLSCCALALGLGGCAVSAERWLALDQLPPPEQVQQQLVLQSSAGIAPDEDVLALSPEVHAFIDTQLRPHGQRERLRRLGELFAREGELALVYDQEVTRPASGVFASRRGNCLSFTQLFIAMARELDIHARFQEARTVGSWTRLGDVLLINRHITAWGFVPGATYEADFGDFDLAPTSMRQLVSDERARAQYFNNLGVEAVARGTPATALPYFNRALVLAPRLAYVWTNLGTALRQLDRGDDAELAFRHALRLDATSLPALGGIARIEAARGNQQTAAALQRLAERLGSRNPYQHFATAQAALARGDYPDAVQSLRTAIRLNPNELDFRFELGRAYLAMGKIPNAQAVFEELQALIVDEDQSRIYAERLRRLLAEQPPPVDLARGEGEGPVQAGQGKDPDEPQPMDHRDGSSGTPLVVP
jgi:Flp pilus assembly protein TadD